MEIIIIDDNDMICKLLKEIIEDLSFDGETFTFTDTETALHHIDKMPRMQRVIISDNNLGAKKRTGAEFSKLFNRDLLVYFVLMSGNVIDDSAHRAKEFYEKSSRSPHEYIKDLLERTRFI